MFFYSMIQKWLFRHLNCVIAGMLIPVYYGVICPLDLTVHYTLGCWITLLFFNIVISSSVHGGLKGLVGLLTFFFILSFEKVDRLITGLVNNIESANLWGLIGPM